MLAPSLDVTPTTTPPIRAKLEREKKRAETAVADGGALTPAADSKQVKADPSGFSIFMVLLVAFIAFIVGRIVN